MGRGSGGHATPNAPDHADGGSGEPRPYSDRPRGVLGTDGLRDDGRDHRRDATHLAVPAGSLCCIVPG
jgi:hypothetical protein